VNFGIAIAGGNVLCSEIGLPVIEHQGSKDSIAELAAFLR
jgi:hypothetical protein